jgi:alpha-L-rhamnosidase
MQATISRVRIVGLKVDCLERPMGLENVLPRFSWRLESHERGVRQSAYRILVASDEERLKAGRGDLWNSGKISSARSIGVRYTGRQLTSRQRCWWCVQVWDDKGLVSAPSTISWWEMGLLDPKDWTAQWLAVEDAVAKADRIAGLHWIWGGAVAEAGSHRFRLKFHLPVASLGGEFFAAINEWEDQITGIWIDGAAVVGARSVPLSGQQLTFAPLGGGDHLIAVEVNAPAQSVSSERIHAIALFARLILQNKETLRIGSGASWKFSLSQDDAWNTLKYNDNAWEAARTVSLEGYQPWPARPAMYLRREFVLDKPVVQARLYATALGAYEARLNGDRVGDALLTPEISQYAKRALYRVYDVTAMLRPRSNALGLVVGDGWYASFSTWAGRFTWGLPPCRVFAQLEIIFADGSRQIIATGPGWRTAESPIRASEIRVGEIYDARLEQPGWDSAEFDDSHWRVADLSEVPSCRLVAQINSPIRVTETLKPRTITQPTPGIYVFDFGQNMAGWCRLQTKGTRGRQVELKFAERLTASGEVEQTLYSIGEPKRDIFILKGHPSGEAFEPHFTYRGFRYVQASGLPTAPTKESIVGLFAHSDLDATGELRVDAPLIEEIWRATVRTQRSNFVGIPTDCPSREQVGWMGDAGVFWDAATFIFDVDAFSARQMDNVTDEQTAKGALPMLAPAPSRSSPAWYVDGSPPAWSDGGIILPWTIWQRYGDLAVVERNWEAMNRHLRFVLDHNPDYLWRNKRGMDFGDWLATGQVSLYDPKATPTTPKDLIGTAYWAHSADLLAQMAQATGRMDAASELRALFQRLSRAFSQAFVKPDGTVGNGSQTSYILALKFGLLPEEMRQVAAQRLAADIRERGISLTTGILGTQFSLDVLSDMGSADLAYSLLLRTDYPSWGYMIRNGATTIWENWSGELDVNNVPTSFSRNHYALGAICGYLFRRVAGIDTATPGFETIIVRPTLDPRVRSGGGDYDSVMGRISTDWTQSSQGEFTLEVTLPANTTARIHLPARRGSRIVEGGEEISGRNDMRILSRLDREVIVEVGSGIYRFAVSD